jgi:sphingomyelin phosphodiesterase acid-like 3
MMLALASIARAQPAPRPAPADVPAIFLSDIHLDPYHDPSKIARLNTASASEWAAILGAPDTAARGGDAAKLQITCPVRGTDTTDTLWESSLQALHAQAAAIHPKFVTISGDLLAHSFDCKFHTLLPNASHEQYAAFTEKTVRYILTSLKAAIPNTPIYLALGNNDSACKDYQLSPAHDEFLGLTAKIAAEVLPEGDRPAVLSTFAESGSYSAPLAGVPETRIIVLDDVFLSNSYAHCGGAKDPAPAQAQIVWLDAQLADARAHNQRVWVMGHIPPSIDLYNTARHLVDVCGGGRPIMFLSAGALADTLAKNSDIVRLALFGHTHSDEIELVAAQSNDPAVSPSAPGVPVKVTASISPVNGNRPSFTVARIDPKTATLRDFTVYKASNATGIAATWTKEYTYSSAYHEPAFDGASVSSLITGFQSDPRAETDASKAYLKNFYPGDTPSPLVLVWPEYACSMNHQTAQSFAGCVCKRNTQP